MPGGRLSVSITAIVTDGDPAPIAGMRKHRWDGKLQQLAALVTVAVPTPAAVPTPPPWPSRHPCAVAKPRPHPTRVEEGGWLNNRWQPLDD